jgi:hypothetical protein
MQTMTESIGRRAALLTALRENGDWMTRDQLATATGKRILSPNDRTHLDNMEREGEIEVTQRSIKSPRGYELLYRVKQS